ncbi:hypothetical protein [Streptantibioticus ferralitis]|uniref:Uncharacterized protein n=1 Tax=Streptantibioticus ferralitis TaxID=236510 RepID=A0ABT5Z8S5_9ACTN|nr:hypothetical protein [Streptantibioticus ferralitis]MDF2260234.1 hypothetical protein [Streptantibioticus ferralitis]
MLYQSTHRVADGINFVGGRHALLEVGAPAGLIGASPPFLACLAARGGGPREIVERTHEPFICLE